MSILGLVVGIDLVGPQMVNLLRREVRLLKLREISFKHGIPHHVDVDDIIENGISKRFQLLVVLIHLKIATCRWMSYGSKQKFLIFEVIVQNISF